VTTAAALLAVALWIGPGPAVVRARAALPLAARLRGKVPRPRRGPDPLAVASSLDVLAVCLEAGMAVSTAAAATAPSAPPRLAGVLRRAADLLALGAEPAVAWSVSPDTTGSVDAQTDALLRLARRSASSGAALARGVAELADQCRHEAAHAATAAAERAGVLIAGPLGLCFLPAFVCLGIVPVVAGLAGAVLQSGVL
jgi:pilus assembly protein TadC